MREEAQHEDGERVLGELDVVGQGVVQRLLGVEAGPDVLAERRSEDVDQGDDG